MDIGFIGAGGRAGAHLQRLDGFEDVAITAICDVDEEQAESVAGEYDATAYTDHHDMYDAEELDAVFVVLPPFAHSDQELIAAREGIHLFVEKPLALTAETAREIEDAIEEAGIVAAVGYQNRYDDRIERARELLDGRQVGYVDASYRAGGPPPKDWWRTYEQSGGQPVEQSTHTFDMTRWLADDVEAVAAAGGQEIVTDVIDFPDSTAATLEHENGTVSNVTATCAAPSYGGGYEVVAEDCYLRIEDDRVVGTVDGEDFEYEADDSDSTTKELEAFVAACRDGDPDAVRSDYTDARRSLEVTLAVNESIETGERVDPADVE